MQSTRIIAWYDAEETYALHFVICFGHCNSDEWAITASTHAS